MKTTERGHVTSFSSVSIIDFEQEIFSWVEAKENQKPEF